MKSRRSTGLYFVFLVYDILKYIIKIFIVKRNLTRKICYQEFYRALRVKWANKEGKT